MKGYKGMLRDRIPLMPNLALKWCKAKDKWINHTYDNFVNIFKDKILRKEATQMILGVKKGYYFEFEKTIMWENLDEDEYHYWKVISGWINWFCKMYQFVENDYKIYIGKGILSEEEIQNIICQHYSLNAKFYKYLMKCFKTYE